MGLSQRAHFCSRNQACAQYFHNHCTIFESHLPGEAFVRTCFGGAISARLRQELGVFSASDRKRPLWLQPPFAFAFWKQIEYVIVCGQRSLAQAAGLHALDCFLSREIEDRLEQLRTLLRAGLSHHEEYPGAVLDIAR